LRRGPDCVPVHSNLDDDGILACPLVRSPLPLAGEVGSRSDPGEGLSPRGALTHPR
jgi:hypothetical protein